MTSSRQANDKEAIADECIQSLVAFQRSLENLSVPNDLQKAAALGYGWWIRVIRTSEAIRSLHSLELSNEASPLVRTLLHHAAALSWLNSDPSEVLEAVLYEHEHRRQKLGSKAYERQWDLNGLELGPPPPKTPKPHGMELLEKFEKLCDRINARNIYVAYMIESGEVHPSIVSANTYLVETGEKVALRSEPAMPGVPLRATAMFAAAATNEFGTMIKDESFRKIADEVGERLETSVELPSDK